MGAATWSALPRHRLVVVARSQGNRFETQCWGTWPTAEWQDVLVGDFDGDGRSDLLAMTAAGCGGSPSRAAITSIADHGPAPIEIRWCGVTVGDVNGDGRDDLVGCDEQTGDIALMSEGSRIWCGMSGNCREEAAVFNWEISTGTAGPIWFKSIPVGVNCLSGFRMVRRSTFNLVAPPARPTDRVPG